MEREYTIRDGLRDYWRSLGGEYAKACNNIKLARLNGESLDNAWPVHIAGDMPNGFDACFEKLRKLSSNCQSEINKLKVEAGAFTHSQKAIYHILKDRQWHPFSDLIVTVAEEYAVHLLSCEILTMHTIMPDGEQLRVESQDGYLMARIVDN